MLKAIRYTLTAICLAASVGSLALWWRSVRRWEIHEWLTQPPFNGQIFETIDGIAAVEFNHAYKHAAVEEKTYYYTSLKRLPSYGRNYQHLDVDKQGLFRLTSGKVHFPLWFPALVFALAAFAALRIGRQFTLRSALAGMSVVAVLLGMVAAL